MLVLRLVILIFVMHVHRLYTIGLAKSTLVNSIISWCHQEESHPSQDQVLNVCFMISILLIHLFNFLAINLFVSLYACHLIL